MSGFAFAATTERRCNRYQSILSFLPEGNKTAQKFGRKIRRIRATSAAMAIGCSAAALQGLTSLLPFLLIWNRTVIFNSLTDVFAPGSGIIQMAVKKSLRKILLRAYPMKTEHFCSQVVPTNLDLFRS